MVKNCGKCEHFIQIDGMFGGCGAGERERFDHETFSSVPACMKFVVSGKEKIRQEFEQKFTDYNGHPMGQMMSMMFGMPPGTMMTMGAGLPPGMMPPEQPKEQAPWVNPLIKNPKPPKPAKVVNLAEWRSEKGK